MIPKYLTDDNKAAKLFREDFYATSKMLEIGISEILRDEAAAGNKDPMVTVRMVKRKMHEILFEFGMSGFKSKTATEGGKFICKEMFPEFYEEMVELPVQKATTDKKPPVKKETAKAKAPVTKKTPAPAKKSTKKDATPKKDTAQPTRKGATAPDFAEEIS